MKYTTTFKKAVLRKVLPPENRSVHSVAVELGVGEMTIHRWLSQVKDGTISFEQGEENPSGQRNMTEKLNLLLEYQKIPQEQNVEMTATLNEVVSINSTTVMQTYWTAPPMVCTALEKCRYETDLSFHGAPHGNDIVV